MFKEACNFSFYNPKKFDNFSPHNKLLIFFCFGENVNKNTFKIHHDYELFQLFTSLFIQFRAKAVLHLTNFKNCIIDEKVL